MNLFDELLNSEESEQIRRINGVTTGIVKENWDQKHPGMVKVEISIGEKGESLTDWVRVLRPYAGNNYGLYMLPEVGDEVLVSFNMGDTNRPYVLGCLWNDKKKVPQKTAVEKNTIKRIKTKGGHEIVFEEEKNKERIEIHTPKNLKITLEDEKQTISIQDEKGENLLSINSKSGEITVKSKNDIKLDAGGKSVLELSGKGNTAKLTAGNITIEAKQTLQLKGQNLKAQGNMVEIKGSGSTKVESSAILTLKGSMTKIN